LSCLVIGKKEEKKRKEKLIGILLKQKIYIYFYNIFIYIYRYYIYIDIIFCATNRPHLIFSPLRCQRHALTREPGAIGSFCVLNRRTAASISSIFVEIFSVFVMNVAGDGGRRRIDNSNRFDSEEMKAVFMLLCPAAVRVHIYRWLAAWF